MGVRDPVPSVLELQELFGGRRVLLTGGGGSIAGALATFVLGFRPERIALLENKPVTVVTSRHRVFTRSAVQIIQALAAVQGVVSGIAVETVVALGYPRGEAKRWVDEVRAAEPDLTTIEEVTLAVLRRRDSR